MHMSTHDRAVPLPSDDIARHRSPLADGGGDLPWIGYDDQDAATIVRFVAKSSPTQARDVGDYERAHRDRELVIAATKRRLIKLHA
jgi:hypothetical protein